MKHKTSTEINQFVVNQKIKSFYAFQSAMPVNLTRINYGADWEID